MTTNDQNTPSTESPLQRRRLSAGEYLHLVREQAPITFWIAVTCVAIFLVINMELLALATTRVFRFLGSDLFSYWTTRPWSLLTSNFVHRGILHLVFNMYWMLYFGPIFEMRLGRRQFLLLILAGCLVTSGLTVLLAQQATIGISGVLYAFVGYAFVVDRKREDRLISPRLKRFFLIWLAVGLLFNQTGFTNISNMGHFTGLLAGMAVAVLELQGNRYVLASPLIILGIAVVLSFYMPWSDAWNAREDARPLMELIDEADRDDPESQAAWGSYLVRSRATILEGALRLKSAADNSDALSLNAYAWFLSTTPGILGDLISPVRWAEQAAEASGWSDAAILDTLAAAHAREGDYRSAADWQQQALDRLPADSNLEAEMTDRLTLYTSGEDFRIPFGYDDLM